MCVLRAKWKRPFQDAPNTPTSYITTTCNCVYGMYHPIRILLSMNCGISTVKEQRAGICHALRISIKNPGWEYIDDKPSVLIIYDVIAPVSFQTVQHLYGNTITSLSGGPTVSSPSQSKRGLIDGSSHVLQVHWQKESTNCSYHIVLSTDSGPC